MTCTIGRVGVSTANGGDGLSLADPFDWQVSGRQVTITGTHRAASDAAATWFAEQIMGLDPALNLDEDAVPFTSTAVPTLDGFYSVEGAQATVGRGALGSGTRDVEWQVTMRRVLDSRLPRIELPHAYAFLTNTLGVTSGDLLLAIPSNTASEFLKQSFTPTAVPSARGGSDANNMVASLYYDGLASGNSGYYTAQYVTTPAAYYLGSARVHQATLGTVVGRRDVTYPSASDPPLISNGIIRVKFVSGTGFVFEGWNGTTWGTILTALLYEAAGTPLQFTPESATVIKNAPDEAVLRVTLATPLTYTGAIRSGTVDFSVRRGDQLIRVGCGSNVVNGFKLYSSPALAGTSITGGIRATSANGDGLYVVMTSNNAATRDTANLGLSGTGNAKTLFGVGWANGTGSNLTTYKYVDDVAASFFFAHATTQRIVVG